MGNTDIAASVNFCKQDLGCVAKYFHALACFDEKMLRWFQMI